jgi:regulator of RNase E activity RraA
LSTPLTAEVAGLLRQFDACALANAIETFDVRLRNEGFTDRTIRSMFPELPPVVGHAVTARIRCSAPPPTGGSYHDRTDWWNYIATVPGPRIVVVQDVDEQPGLGAWVGEVHTEILRALDCVGYVTNGSVRDLPAVRTAGFPMFAASVAVSHAFAHMVSFGDPVTVGGLVVATGDILFADVHGVLMIPPAVVAELPPVTADMLERERAVIALCRSPHFSIEQLRTLVRQLG